MLQSNFNQTEIETIRLCIALEAIGDIANHQLVELREVCKFPGEYEVYFHESVHQQLFLIRLLDFAKESCDSKLTGVKGSILNVLEAISSSGLFDVNGSISALQGSIESLNTWLNTKKNVRLWLPSLDVEAELSLSYLEFLTITGNHSKHNLARLTGVSNNIFKILEAHGYTICSEEIPFALDDFEEHLQENYFIYYGTWITELLNNIRWGIQEYLQPTFETAYRSENSICRYTYEFPGAIQDALAKKWFWWLMNNIRTGPYLKKFKGASYLKHSSSLEY